MVKLHPLNQFCCGCSLPFGSKTILFTNLMLNVFYIATAVANIVLRVPHTGFGEDMAHQTFNAAFCLVGIPFIVAALYGVSYRQESHVRLYLYYMFASFALDIAYCVYFLVMQDSCSMLPGVLKQHGSAFACGAARIFVVVFMVVITAITAYCMYTIWSQAEDIRVGGSSTGFPELLQEAIMAREAAGRSYDTGMLGTGAAAGPTKALSYGSLGSFGVGGGNAFFGGKNHEVNFPPKSVD